MARTVGVRQINVRLLYWCRSVAEWLACSTQAPGLQSQSRRLGKLLTLIVPLFTKQRNW